MRHFHPHTFVPMTQLINEAANCGQQKSHALGVTEADACSAKKGLDDASGNMIKEELRQIEFQFHEIT